MKKINPFIHSNSNKRYYTFDYYLKSNYKSKIAKIGLDAGFTCPNRDGKISKEGCLFCSDGARSNILGDIENLKHQFVFMQKIMHAKWPTAKFIAYFQAYTNTYETVENLKNKFEPFISKKDIVALSIATRPDCLDDEIIDYLASINKRIPLYLELGLQTSNDETAKLINRGYLFSDFIQAIEKLSKHKINIVVHLINGLPNETIEKQLQTILDIRNLPIMGIKFHSLFIEKDTKLHDYYLNYPFKILSMDEYLDILIKQLELLPAHIVIHRISGDPIANKLVAPLWSANKMNVANSLDKEMLKRETYQGRYFVL